LAELLPHAADKASSHITTATLYGYLLIQYFL
jgi:hypothetical protein